MNPHLRPRRALSVATLVLSAALAAGACTTGSAGTGGGAVPTIAARDCPTSQPAPLGKGETRTVTIKTSKGAIAIKVDGSLSPIAAGNFVALASCHYYDGVVFHRVVPGFVIQGGDGQYARAGRIDAARVGQGGPGYSIQDEPVTSTYRRGTVAMARSSQPNSQGSQFFIVLSDDAASSLGAPQYNDYAIFGTVTSGLDAVDAIASAADREIPSNPIAMDTVTVSTP
jgi:cyclophilin family peptidyl-prolyl cis-trans isomerase